MKAWNYDGRGASSMKAWHFVGDTLRDGRPVPEDGEWLVHEGEIEMCASGLHASERLIDALNYAPGNTLCRVECRGDLEEGYDKIVCRERKILWRVDAEDLLQEAVRKFALDVIHLWDAPEVVKNFLETGDESLMDAAWDAARAAARDAAGGARDAAWAARAAAGGARAAAWAASWDAAGGARAARAAAWAAGGARAAVREDQNQILLNLVEEHRA